MSEEVSSIEVKKVKKVVKKKKSVTIDESTLAGLKDGSAPVPADAAGAPVDQVSVLSSVSCFTLESLFIVVYYYTSLSDLIMRLFRVTWEINNYYIILLHNFAPSLMNHEKHDE